MIVRKYSAQFSGSGDMKTSLKITRDKFTKMFTQLEKKTKTEIKQLQMLVEQQENLIQSLQCKSVEDQNKIKECEMRMRHAMEELFMFKVLGGDNVKTASAKLDALIKKKID